MTTPRALAQQSSCSTPSRRSAEVPLLSLELKNYFGILLTSSRPQKKATSRKRLTGIGESLTSEEAMCRVRADLDGKKKLEEIMRRKENGKK